MPETGWEKGGSFYLATLEENPSSVCLFSLFYIFKGGKGGKISNRRGSGLICDDRFRATAASRTPAISSKMQPLPPLPPYLLILLRYFQGWNFFKGGIATTLGCISAAEAQIVNGGVENGITP
jgi:hypothetical protein